MSLNCVLFNRFYELHEIAGCESRCWLVCLQPPMMYSVLLCVKQATRNKIFMWHETLLHWSFTLGGRLWGSAAPLWLTEIPQSRVLAITKTDVFYVYICQEKLSSYLCILLKLPWGKALNLCDAPVYLLWTENRWKDAYRPRKVLTKRRLENEQPPPRPRRHIRTIISL